ncbi:hypothetical protein O1611_g1099 [Lasiodiplodia mahajangana]|uniref:Uncharacterized protein n=1 Tax=Lasiodiplodia mahajangana TaxID=1108764 RepID=A0ACC2JZ25_9PEZI|nr:hypothetical protein O1611_g1099 [Lasiodiplodia mahajangana]
MVSAGDDNAPMLGSLQPESASGSGPGPGSAVTKPKRRFIPQLIEQTTKSSSNRKQQQDAPLNINANANTNASSNYLPSSSPGITTDSTRSAVSNVTPTTRDASVQVNDSDMPAPQPPMKPIRRFAPVPIETTFDSYRVANKNPHGPAPEPTPDPSPTTSHSSSTFSTTGAPVAPETTEMKAQEKRPKRRFTPQLIETTKRAWRTGQEGPATQPTDKTDITPGTNHIYAPKPKRNHGAHRSGKSNTSLAHAIAKEGNDDEASPRFLSPRRQRSLKIQPNTRRSTRNTSYHPELDTILSSESGNSSEDEGSSVAAPAPVLNSKRPGSVRHVQRPWGQLER